MRFALSVALCLSAPAHADSFTLRSTPDTVIVYPQGAKVTRNLSVALPAGTHDVILPDLPEEVLWQPSPQISVTGAVLGAVSLRGDALPPLADADPEAIEAARQTLKAAQQALTRHRDAEADIQLQSDAAAAQIAFLEGLTRNEGLPADVAGLRDIATMIGDQTLAARQQMLRAEQSVRDMGDRREELEKEVQAAQEALAALTTARDDRAQLTLAVTAAADATARISVSYLVSARWQPVYDISLEQTDPARLSVKRGAAVTQQSGEDWQDVSLTLSTVQPSGRIAPSPIPPRRVRIVEPARPKADIAQLGQQRAAPMEAIVDAPAVMEEAVVAVARFAGPGVSYVFPDPVTVANDVDATRITLDTLAFETEIFARAVPLRDSTAFLMARFTNTAPEPLYGGGEVAYYLDNGLIGFGDMAHIAAGEEAELSFGPIEDLQLERVVLDLNEGDSGILTRSNTRDEEIRISIDNIGGRTWPIELLDRVPFSEQEDLVITYSATPPPDQQNPEDLRGILRWDLELAGGDSQSIVLRQNLKWPDGMILQ